MGLAGLPPSPGLPRPPHPLYRREKEMFILVKTLFFKALLLAAKLVLTVRGCH